MYSIEFQIDPILRACELRVLCSALGSLESMPMEDDYALLV